MEQMPRTNRSPREPDRRFVPLTVMLKLPQKKVEVICLCGSKFAATDLGRFTRKICDACIKKAELTEDLRVQAEAVMEAEKAQRERVKAAHIPADFQNVSFDTSNSKIHPAALAACQHYAMEFKGSSPSLILYSEVFGSGKTHLAACIANYLLNTRHINVRFARAFDIIQEIRGTFNRGTREDEDDVLKRILSPTLLVIDDLGLTTPTDWSAETYWAMFDRRKEFKYPVVVTTNYYPNDEELGARIGKGALSRLLGMCGDNIITFKGKDLRRG
jgi:DNA replication protein DnaC